MKSPELYAKGLAKDDARKRERQKKQDELWAAIRSDYEDAIGIAKAAFDIGRTEYPLMSQRCEFRRVMSTVGGISIINVDKDCAQLLERVARENGVFIRMRFVRDVPMGGGLVTKHYRAFVLKNDPKPPRLSFWKFFWKVYVPHWD